MTFHIRFWWPGYSPEEALDSFDITVVETPFDVSSDGGKTWRSPLNGATLETVQDWIWEVDSRGIYTYVSPRVRDILGYEPEELLGKTPFDVMPPEEAKRIRDIFQDIMSKKA